jgi:DNA-directed RNA polymerase specialized sigma24 family protein
MLAEDSAKREILSDLKTLLEKVTKAYDVTPEEIAGLIEKDTIPLDAFSKELTVLETASKYLHENHKKSFAEIARITGKDPRAVRITYIRAQNKSPELIEAHSKASISPRVFASNLSPLEAVVLHLRENKHNAYDIAKILQRSENTIRTIIRRLGVKLNE